MREDFFELAAGDRGMSEVCEDCTCFVKLVAEFWAAGKDENDVLVSPKEAEGIEEWYGSVVVIFNKYQGPRTPNIQMYVVSCRAFLGTGP
jgi:hypothetical protein